MREILNGELSYWGNDCRLYGARVHSTAACGGLPLTACSGCAILPGAAGDISSRAAPFPMIGKGRGDRVERAVKPLTFHGWTVSI